MLLGLVFSTLQAVVDCEVMQISQVFVHPQNLFMLDRLLHFSLCRIALLLLFDKFLNLRCVQARRGRTLVLNFADFDYSFDSRFNVSIG